MYVFLYVGLTNEARGPLESHVSYVFFCIYHTHFNFLIVLRDLVYKGFKGDILQVEHFHFE